MNNYENSCKSGSCTPNRAIGCTVSQCAHHCGMENYCSLNHIQVVTHESNPTMTQCTDCASFKAKG